MFNLHFMNGFSEHKRFRGAKFEVEVHSTSTIEAPEMLFVRLVGSSESPNKFGSSTHKPNDERAIPSTQEKRQKDSCYQRPRLRTMGASPAQARLVQGMVLPPSIARWKICESTESKDGIPQYIKLQAMVRSRGGFAIEVKDFQVKLGYRDWLWPNRLLRAPPTSRPSELITLLDHGVSKDEHNRPSADYESILQPRSGSIDSLKPQVSFGTKTESDRHSHRAYGVFSSFQAWLDSPRNFDKPEKLKLQALQEFMSLTYEDRRASLQPGKRSPVMNEPSQRHTNWNSNSTEMNVLVGELNSESDLLEAWLRRESLRRKAIETCLDTVDWDVSSHTGRRVPPLDYRESGLQIRQQSPHEVETYCHCGAAPNLERSRRVTVPMRDDMLSEQRQSDILPAGTAGPHPGRRSEKSIDPLRGEGLRRIWTTHDSVREVGATKLSKAPGIKGARPRVVSPTEADWRLSPTRAWKELGPAY